MNRCFFIYY